MFTSNSYLKQIVLSIALLLFFTTSHAQIPANISTAGTWSASSGSGSVTFAAGACYTVTVTAFGGGGGGGGALGDGASGGGSGGGYAQAVVSVGPGIYYYSVGAGGTAGNTSGNNGGNGGPTWFNGTAGTNNNTTGSFINAGGGYGGLGATTNIGAAAQPSVGTGTFGASGLSSTVSFSGGTGGGGFVNGGGDGGGGGGGGGAGSGGNGGNGATTTVGGAGLFGCPNGGGGGGGGGGGATGPGANGNPGNSNGGGGTGGAANGGGSGGTANANAAGLGGNGTAGGAGTAAGGGGGAGNGCCGCNGGAGGDGAAGTNTIGGGGGGGTGDGGGGTGGNGGAHGGGGAGADGSSTATGGTGGAGYLTITVAVATPPTATAGPALTAICQGATTPAMGGTVSAGATALWSGGIGTWTNATNASTATYTAGPAETGTITLTLTATNACGTISVTKTLTINPAPVAPTVTSPVTYCQNATATALTATAAGGLLWYTVATGGVGSATAPTPSTVTVGSTTYYVSQTQTGCESARTPIVVTVTPAPTATASNTGPFCISGNITINATGGNTYSWSGPNAYSSTASSPAPFSAATYGSGTYTVTVTSASACTATASTNVVVNTTPAPTVTSPVTYCQNATATALTATAAGSLLWYTVATGGTGSATAPTPLTATSGSTTYYVSQTQAGCESARIAIVVTINPSPVTTASNSGPFCINGNITISATGGNTYSWSGPNAYSGTGASPAPFSSATYGAGTYIVTVTDANSCTATASTNVVVNTTPAPTVTSPVTYCQNATATALTATATGSLLWYTTATGGTSSATAPIPSTATVGSTTYYVSQTQGGCESTRASIVVTVIPSPTATANNTGPYCTDGIIVLSATGGNSYSWSCSNGYTGTGASPLPFSATPYGAGTFTYTVTVTAANACTATASTSVVVNSTTIPTNVGVGANLLTPCIGDTLKLLGSATGATQWSWTGPGGFTSALQNPIIVIPVTGFYTLSASNACGTATNTATIHITVDSLSASIGGTLSYCNGGNTTLTANPSGATTYAWSNGNSTISTSATVSGNPYQVTVTDANGCSASASTTVSVDNPTATVSGNLNYCPGSSTTLTANAGSAYLWSDAANSTTQSILVSTAGTYNVTVTDATGCTATANATVILTPPPAIPTVISPVTYCQNAAATALTAAATGSLLWYTVATGGTGSAIAPTPSTATSGSSTYYVSQTQGSCESARDSIIVIINPTPIATASNTGPFCISGTITINATGGNTYSWSGPNAYSSTAASPAPFSALTYGAGAYTVTVTDVNSCTTTANTNVVVNSPVTVPISQTICSGQSVNFGSQTISATGVYNDTLISSYGCDSIVILTLSVLPKPVASFSIQPTGDSLYLGTRISVTNTSTNSNSSQWLLNNQVTTLLSDNLLPISDSGQYCVSLVADNALGCADTSAQQCIIILNNVPQPFFMPNAFTPNGDGINDVIEVFGNKAFIVYLSIQVYNRWGEKIFSSNDSGFNWDGTYKGTPQPPGVYVYLLDITLTSGQSIHNQGSISLIR